MVFFIFFDWSWSFFLLTLSGGIWQLLNWSNVCGRGDGTNFWCGIFEILHIFYRWNWVELILDSNGGIMVTDGEKWNIEIFLIVGAGSGHVLGHDERDS